MLLLVSREPEHVVEWVVALRIAMAMTLALLVYAERIAKLFG
jgi:small neutral amino acid transporter SnatA (MarC family)